jgi:hypothetical protein
VDGIVCGWIYSIEKHLDEGTIEVFAALHESGYVQVFGRRDDGLTTRRGGRGPKSAKARNRGGCGTRRCSRLYGDCMSALWTGSGREVATRMAERFHNFRVSA